MVRLFCVVVVCLQKNKSFLSNFCTQKFARVWGEEPQHSNKIYKTLEAVCCFDAAARQCVAHGKCALRITMRHS